MFILGLSKKARRNAGGSSNDFNQSGTSLKKRASSSYLDRSVRNLNQMVMKSDRAQSEEEQVREAQQFERYLTTKKTLG